MSWQFQQSTGQVTGPSGMRYGCSYAGHGDGKNNPAMQSVENVGPLPCGEYTINPPVDTQTHGPFVMWLTPDPENEMYGRSGFGWHGDSIEHPGLASDGCICSPRTVRELVWNSGDHRLQVVA